jgi:hypothetical protein
VRKARRACPAQNRAICAICCATKRGREINCPPDCAYLSSSRDHPAAVVQRRQQRDMRFFVSLLEGLTERQYRLMLLFQALVVKHAADAVPALLDRDVADAADAVAATLETADRGIIYEHQAASIPAQRLAAELRRAAADLARGDRAPAGIDTDIALALRRMQQGATDAARVLDGDPPPVFLALLGRLMAAAPDQGRTQGNRVII